MVERTVSIEAIDTEDRRLIPYQVLRFAIEPPIQVHEPSFLSDALKREAQRTPKYSFGQYPYVASVNLTYTDEQATYGTIEVHAKANKDSLCELITTAFGKELNPLGRVALDFDFDADFSGPA